MYGKKNIFSLAKFSLKFGHLLKICECLKIIIKTIISLSYYYYSQTRKLH